MKDVTFWTYYTIVNFGAFSGEVVDDTVIYDLNCWVVRINENRSVYYDSESGFLLASVLQESDISDPQDSWIFHEEITLVDMYTEGLDGRYLPVRGVFLSGILIELAVIIWLLQDRRKTPE